MFMLILIFFAAVRAHGDFHTSNVLTYLLLGGFLAALASAGALSVTMHAGQRRRRPEQVPTEARG